MRPYTLSQTDQNTVKSSCNGAGHTFFAHHDSDFGAHKAGLISQLDTISDVLSAQSQGPIGYVKVILKREAWAKSHRPVGALFRIDRTAEVGGGHLGVMIVEGHPSACESQGGDRESGSPHAHEV